MSRVNVSEGSFAQYRFRIRMAVLRVNGGDEDPTVGTSGGTRIPACCSAVDAVVGVVLSQIGRFGVAVNSSSDLGG